MPISFGSSNVGAVSYGATPIKEMYHGGDLVWQADSREIIVIDGSSSASAQIRKALSDRGFDYKTVTEIPFRLNTSRLGNAYEIFSNFSALTVAPKMDTSNVTSMGRMFFNCSALATVPDLDTSNVTSTSWMFSGCSALATVPDLDTSNVTSASWMFSGCKKITDGNVRCIGKASGVSTSNMINGSGMTRLPFYDSSGNWTG